MSPAREKIGLFDHVDDLIISMDEGAIYETPCRLQFFEHLKIQYVQQKNDFDGLARAYAASSVLSMAFWPQIREEDRDQVPDRCAFMSAVIGISRRS